MTVLGTLPVVLTPAYYGIAHSQLIAVGWKLILSSVDAI